MKDLNSLFYNPLLNNKKAVVSITTFVLLVLVILLVFLSSYGFYSDSVNNAEILFKEKENLNQIMSLRSELIGLLVYVNSSLNYSDEFASEDIEIILRNSTITGLQEVNSELVEVSISSLGINFDQEYRFFPIVGGVFVHNESGNLQFTNN